MKRNKERISFLLKALILFLIATAQASSQDGCQIDETLLDLFNNKLNQISSTTPGGPPRDVFVCNLSFIDGITKTGFLSEEGKLIDQAVKDGMTMAAAQNARLIINDPNHTVPNLEANVTQLIDIYFDPALTQKQKYEKVVAKLLDPYNVDILVTGVIVDTGGVIQVRPFGVSKPDKTIKTKDIQYANRSELFQKVNSTLALTKRAHEEIQAAVKSILEES